MDLNAILKELDEEIARLVDARRVLASLNGQPLLVDIVEGKRRKMSAAARKRISLAQKKRWREQKTMKKAA